MFFGTLARVKTETEASVLSSLTFYQRLSLVTRHCGSLSDTVHGGTHSAVARYILHSDVQVSAVGNNSWQLTLTAGQSLRVLVLAGMGHVEAASYAPEFGIVLPTKSLVVELTQGQARVEGF